MANINVTPGTGKTVGTDSVGGVEYQKIKIVDGTPGNDTNMAAVSANGLEVDVKASVLPSGASTGAKQDTGNTSLASIDTNTTNAAASLSVLDDWDESDRAKVNIVAGQAGVTAGAGAVAANTPRVTLASDDPGVTSLQLIDDTVFTDDTSTHSTGVTKGLGIMAAATPTDASVNANDIGMVAMTTDRKLHVSVQDALPAGSNAIGKLAANSGVDIGDVDITSVVPGTAATNLGKAEDAAHTSGDTGVFSLGVANEAQSTFGADGDYAPQSTDTKGNNMVVGNLAHDAVDAGNPVKIGGKAVNAEPAAVANADRANLITDLVGKLITLPYANPENFVSGAITSAMTGTTSTSLIAAPASGLRNYITTIIVSNSHATVGTDIIIQDGNGGTTLMTIPAAAVYGGAVINLPVPLRQPTTATAIYCANVTTGASTKVSAVGYKGV